MPSSLLTDAQELDLSTRDTFIDSLHDDNERDLVDRVESLAAQPDRRFFHWETEFPEVFFGFADADQRRIKHKDQLTEGLAGFDAIVGNPPYLSYYSRESKKSRDAERRLETYLKLVLHDLDRKNPPISGRVNYFLGFLLLCHTKLGQPFGRLCFILPDTLLINSSYTLTRAYMLRHALLERAVLITDPVFQEATVGSCLVLLSKHAHYGCNVWVWPTNSVATPTESYPLYPRELLKVDLCPIRPLPQHHLKQAASNARCMIALGDIAEVRDGVNPGPGHVRAKLLSDKPAAQSRRLIEGACITPTGIHWQGKYIRYDPSLLTAEDRRAGASLRKPHLFEANKLVYRQTAPHVIAAIDWEGFCATNSVHVILPRDRSPRGLIALCAYLNSAYLRRIYETRTGETRKVFPQVHAKATKRLPVPLALFEYDNPIVQRLMSLYAMISKCEEKLGLSCNSPYEREDSCFETIDALIQELVEAETDTQDRDNP